MLLLIVRSVHPQEWAIGEHVGLGTASIPELYPHDLVEIFRTVSDEIGEIRFAACEHVFLPDA